MFKKNKIRLTDVLSNDSFRLALEELNWIHSESSTHSWEVVKIREVEEKSIFMAIMLRSLTRTLKFGSYTYTKRGVDLLERQSPLITKQTKENKLFKIVKDIVKIPKEVQVKGEGVVIE